MESLLYILRTLVALVIVIWLANVAIKYLNNYSKNDMRNIQIVERISVSKASSLAIVKIVNDYYLMSFSEDKNEIIQKFSKDEVFEIEERLEQKEANSPTEKMKTIDFKETKDKFAQYFEQAMKKKEDKDN